MRGGDSDQTDFMQQQAGRLKKKKKKKKGLNSPSFLKSRLEKEKKAKKGYFLVFPTFAAGTRFLRTKLRKFIPRLSGKGSSKGKLNFFYYLRSRGLVGKEGD